MRVLDIEIFKALSDENRLRIIHLLTHGRRCVCEIETMLEMSQSNVSRHLNKLKDADIVCISKESQWSFYALSDEFKEHYSLILEHLTSSIFQEKIFKDDLAQLSSICLEKMCKTRSNRG